MEKSKPVDLKNTVIMEYCQKRTSWDIYGVRKFPYPGTRKYPPGVHRTFHGSIVIQNDVFGMTIHQFEREFKACLARRKQHQERIQNIRFPNKTTNAYIEYLTYGDVTVEDYNLSYQHRSYCNLVHVAGTELEIRTRQRMFIVKDKIHYKAMDLYRYISSGSLAEGIDLPGSDIDIMFQLQTITVIQDLQYLFSSIEQTIFLVERDMKYPGFCRLKLVAEGYERIQFIRRCMKETDNGIYFSTEKFMHYFGDCPAFRSEIRHGPCLSDDNQYQDIAICLTSKYWPTYGLNWIHRHRTGQWPTENVVDTIVNEGCLFVPIGPKNECNELLWRISFSLAEKRLSHSMNYTQLLCYVLMKLTLKNIINKNEDVKDLLCSYFLKTTLFWLSEEICIDTFKPNNLSYCFSLCIGKLMSFVSNCYCPNYFIPQHNMFIGKVDESNNKLLLSILNELRNTEVHLIIDVIFGNSIINHNVCTMTNQTVDLDLLFYRVSSLSYIKDIDSGYKTLQYINSLTESESSEFMLGVFRFYQARINQQIPQMLVLPEQNRKRYNIIRRCYKHLMDGTKSDAVSGWVLYASFYYILGKYKKSLHILDNVLSRCTPDMIMLHQPVYTTEVMNRYKHKTQSCSSLKHKMTRATLTVVYYIEQSTLIPQELQLEVQDDDLYVPPVVMCQCLQFLCYHHLGDVNNKHRVLRELSLTIKNQYFVPKQQLSQSLVILGVCHELSEDKDTAYHCYSLALQCGTYVCTSAEQRIQNLLI